MKIVSFLFLSLFIISYTNSQVTFNFQPGVTTITERTFENDEKPTSTVIYEYYDNGIIKAKKGKQAYVVENIDSTLYKLKFESRDCYNYVDIEIKGDTLTSKGFNDKFLPDDPGACVTEYLMEDGNWYGGELLQDSIIQQFPKSLDMPHIKNVNTRIYNKQDIGYQQLNYASLQGSLKLQGYIVVQNQTNYYIAKNYLKKRNSNQYSLASVQLLDDGLNSISYFEGANFTMDKIDLSKNNSVYEFDEKGNWIKKIYTRSNGTEIITTREIVYR